MITRDSQSLGVSVVHRFASTTANSFVIPESGSTNPAIRETQQGCQESSQQILTLLSPPTYSMTISGIGPSQIACVVFQVPSNVGYLCFYPAFRVSCFHHHQQSRWLLWLVVRGGVVEPSR